MASTVEDSKSVNGAAESPAKERQKVYIGRRTGAVIKINPRKDSHGFDRIEDYFPDSVLESDNEETNSWDAKPVKLKANQYVGRRTGALIEINARKNRHGFELIEDYFPDSIRESDVSTASNKDLNNDRKLSTSLKTTDKEKSCEAANELKENMSQNMLEPEEKSQVSSLSKENKDVVTPQEREIEISINLTGTAVKNSTASNENTPQFFGSKKRLFTSVAENTDVTRKKIIETEEDIDIVGVSYEEEETNAQHQQKTDNTQTVEEVSMTTEDDSIVVDVEGCDTPCITLNDKSKGSKVKGGVQEDEEATAGKSKDDTLIVDIEDDSTFVTLGEKSKVSMLKSVSRGDLVPGNEESYQMDESAVLEGTKHKAISPEFGSVSTHVSSSSGTENDETEDMAKPKGRRSRKSKKSVSKKSIKEQEREEDENQNDDGDKSVDHQKDDSASMNPVVKRVTRMSMKSVSNKSMKEKQEQSQENVTLNLTGADQTNVDDTARVSPVRMVTRKSKRSAVLNKSTKEKEEENQKDISLNITSADQTYEDDTAHANSMKKTTRKSKKSVSNRSMKEKQLEEDNDIEVTAETKANHDVEDEKTAKKRTLRKSTRTTQEEPDNENTADAVQEEEGELEERVMTRRATRSNTSNHAKIKSTSKKSPAPGRRSTCSEVNKSMTADKNVSGELKNKRKESESKSIGAVEDDVSDGKKHEVQGEDGGNTSRLFEIEDDMPGDAEYEVYDTEVHDTQGEDKCVDTLKDRLSKRRSTRNKSQVNDSKSKSETEEVEESVEEKGGNGSSDADGDDEQESQEIGKKTTKNGKNTKGRKVENKGAAWRATLNNQNNDSNYHDVDDDEDHDDYDYDDDDDHDDDYEYDDKEENNDQDGDGNNSKIISKNARTKPKSSKKSASSSSASDSDKDRVEEKKQPRKQKRKSSKVSMTRRSRRKPSKNYTANETAGNDVTDQEGPADEGDDGTKDDERNDTTVKETVDGSMNKSSRKRTNQTRIESMQVAQSSTPVVLNGSPYILPPGSVKSILKSNIPRTLSTDAKKRRVSIATNKKGSTSGTDDEDEDYGNGEGGKSKFPSRRRKSSVSFAPTPSFHISPDDFSTLEESSGELAKLSFITNYSGFTSGDNTFTPGLLGSASLSSSVSSLGSVSDLLSDTSSVNESQEITINSSKRRQLAEEEEQLDDSGVRRSKRTKVPPLEYWKNERIKYDRRQSGWYVSGIQKVATPVVPKRNNKKRKKQKKTEATGREPHEEEANDSYGKPADMEEVTYTSIPVVNPDNGEQVELDLVHTPEMLNFVNASGKPAEPEDPLIMDKFMSHNLFGTGQIVLRPGAEKGKQHVRDDTMIFYVVKGRVEVTVHETTVLLRTGSTFFVPTGNWYNIKNVQNSDARLLFVQIKG